MNFSQKTALAIAAGEMLIQYIDDIEKIGKSNLFKHKLKQTAKRFQEELIKVSDKVFALDNQEHLEGAFQETVQNVDMLKNAFAIMLNKTEEEIADFLEGGAK